ncbi:small ribosomal subunit protein mS31-like isoform X2 [Rhipicephalus microplus]|uniref:small ribosomal subunit protein mS31-like isoform X2 n=1 Tax=Rhipicephalus microplus TaxID=6941 RepID=UPI003F6AAA06
MPVPTRRKMAASMCSSRIASSQRAMLGSVRYALRPRTKPCRWGAHLARSFCSSSGKSTDDPAGKSEQPAKDEPSGDQKRAALDKLSALLSDMKIESIASTDPNSLSFKLAKPGLPKKPELKEEAQRTKGLGKAVVQAAREVAASLGSSKEQKEQTESELLARLRVHAQERQGNQHVAPEKDNTATLSDLFVGMKIERKKAKQQGRQEGGGRGDRSRRDRELGTVQSEFLPGTIDALTEQVNRDTKAAARRQAANKQERIEEKLELDVDRRLGIFSRDIEENTDVPQLKTWERLQQRELQLLVTPPPKNAYEEMILWTEQGKLWKFPINNEAGLDEEAQISFEEHVFLEEHIADFPERGPIRHFMELVLVGLSKNPHISAQRKREHIEWFRQYFRAKADILRASGVLPEEGEFFYLGQEEERSSIEAS